MLAICSLTESFLRWIAEVEKQGEGADKSEKGGERDWFYASAAEI